MTHRDHSGGVYNEVFLRMQAMFHHLPESFQIMQMAEMSCDIQASDRSHQAFESNPIAKIIHISTVLHVIWLGTQEINLV